MARELVQLPDVYAAREFIVGKVHRTPTVHSNYFSKKTNTNLYFKQELFQKTGSFKVRGVLNKLKELTDEQKKNGIISLSAGNHAQAVAWAASQFGIESTLVMPETAVQTKLQATRDYGGYIETTGGSLLECCLAIQEERNLTLVHPFDDPLIIAGQGTVGLEIIEDVPELDYVITGVGGGGLISGIATAVKAKNSDAKIIGVEPEGAQTMTRALVKGAPVHLTHVNTVADGLAAPFVGQHNLAHVQELVEQIVLVSDAEIITALKLLWERCKVLAEPAAAAGIAALLHHKLDIPRGATVVCVLSGGNVDINGLRNLIDGR